MSEPMQMEKGVAATLGLKPRRARLFPWTKEEDALLGKVYDPRKRRKHRLWTVQDDQLLGTKPDAELAKMFGRTVRSMLGTISDEEVARRTGHSLSSVVKARHKRHIPGVVPVPPEWRADEEALLGTRPDEEIAQVLKRTLAAVRHRRVMRKIPICRP